MKKKIKKFGGGALSAVDSGSIQGSSMDKDSEFYSKFFYRQRLRVLFKVLLSIKI
jgi:hypothetical protein